MIQTNIERFIKSELSSLKIVWPLICLSKAAKGTRGIKLDFCLLRRAITVSIFLQVTYKGMIKTTSLYDFFTEYLRYIENCYNINSVLYNSEMQQKIEKIKWQLGFYLKQRSSSVIDSNMIGYTATLKIFSFNRTTRVGNKCKTSF